MDQNCFIYEPALNGDLLLLKILDYFVEQDDVNMNGHQNLMKISLHLECFLMCGF